MAHNLIVVFGDEMRGQAMACAGDPNVRTPHIDRLAAEGRRFTRAYANTPVCTPARGTILSGLFPTNHGAIVNDLPIRTDVPSIARSLRSAGYACGYVGKWHIAGIPRYKFIPPGPERLGFDDFWAVWNCHHDYFDPKYFLDGPEPIFAEGYEPTVQTDLALDFIRRFAPGGNDDRRFCLFLSWGPPHSPYEPWPPNSEGSYDPGKIVLSPNTPDLPRHRKDLAGYYAHITALDAELGRILDELDARGLRDDTLVVFTSDHGSMLGAQGHYHKQQPWAESINVPLVMRGPGAVPRGVSDLLVGFVDFAPTILGLLGCPIPTRMEGRDLSPQIARDARPPHRAIYIADHITTDQADHQGIIPWRGIKTNRFTYVRNTRGPWLLYDDEADPYQLANLVDKPAWTAVRNWLDTELARQMEFYGDRILTKDEALDYWGVRETYRIRTEHLYAGRNMGGGWPDRPPRKG